MAGMRDEKRTIGNVAEGVFLAWLVVQAKRGRPARIRRQRRKKKKGERQQERMREGHAD